MVILMLFMKYNHDKVVQYHRALDVMVSVSQFDSGPVTLEEAMGCGDVPVIIATNG